jgi:hypothetical protein
MAIGDEFLTGHRSTSNKQDTMSAERQRGDAIIVHNDYETDTRQVSLSRYATKHCTSLCGAIARLHLSLDCPTTIPLARLSQFLWRYVETSRLSFLHV